MEEKRREELHGLIEKIENVAHSCKVFSQTVEHEDKRLAAQLWHARSSILDASTDLENYDIREKRLSERKARRKKQRDIRERERTRSSLIKRRVVI